MTSLALLVPAGGEFYVAYIANSAWAQSRATREAKFSTARETFLTAARAHLIVCQACPAPLLSASMTATTQALITGATAMSPTFTELN